MSKLSRRDFLKLGGLSLGSLAFTPSLRDSLEFDDSNLVRVATASVSVHSQPNDESRIVSTWYRDELIHIYEEVIADAPTYNPVWYRVWGGYVHRSHLQKVKVLFNQTLKYLEDDIPRLVEVTVPFTQPWRGTKIYGWQQLGFRLYYGSVHWVDAIEAGPTGDTWYRIYDDLTGFPYHINPLHVRPIPLDELTAISPDVEIQNKLIDVNLLTQTLKAIENGVTVLDTKMRTVFRLKRRKVSSAFRIRCLPNIWGMAISLQKQTTMNSLASHGPVSLRIRVMPSMALTGMIILVCR